MSDASRTLVLPKQQPSLPESGDGGRWALVIFNNDHTPYDDVIFILMKATECDVQEAMIEAWEAHHFGRAFVHFGSREECEAAGRIVSSIGVKTEVRLEWPDEA